MITRLDGADQKLLDVLQTEIPLVPRPFAELAGQLGLSEEEVLTRVRALKTPPTHFIRQISAIFDSQSLGYKSTLVAARVPEDHLDAAAAIINQHPGVSHNYRRNHAFNLWYTLAVPPNSRLGLEKTIDILHARSGALSTRMLPTLRLFKIGVKFDLSGDADVEARAPATSSPAYAQSQRDAAVTAPLTNADIRFIRLLQQDLPIEAEPFARWTDNVEELLAAARTFLERGQMRRFSAVLRHRQAGISANAMGVWAVPPAEQESFGQTAAGFSAVSHCYLRRSYADWPFTMFTMVHAPSPPRCEAVLASISQATGISQYAALYSTKEYKKVRVQYFTREVDDWESAAAADAATIPVQ